MSKGIILISHTVVVLLVVFILTSVVHAQIQSVTVSVDGMACPFCAYGIEKKLKKVKGVESITIRLQEGTATLSAKEGESIRVSQVPAAIGDAGFTPRKIKIISTGIIKINEQQQFILQLSGLEQRLLLINLKKTTKEQLLSLVKSETLVEVEGIIYEKSEGLWTLFPESVKEVSK